MEMQQVRYFVALAETLNFTRAAERCNVTQPALTRAIQQLEHELGGPLVNRERGKSHLTELGRMMLPYLRQMDEHASTAKAVAKAAKRGMRLTIGAMCTISPKLFTDLLARFQMNHPEFELVFVEGGAKRMIEKLDNGELEIALVGIPEEMPDTLHQVPVFQERFVIVLPPNHRLCANNPVRAAELNDEPYVGRADCEVFTFVRDDLHARGVFMRGVFSSPRDDWVQSMIKAGLGLGFFPEYSVTDPDLVVRPLVEPEYSRTIYLATKRGRPHSPAVGAFVSAARRYTWPSPGSHDTQSPPSTSRS